MSLDSHSHSPEDILDSSLQSLYGYAPISESTPGALYTYNIDSSRLNLSDGDDPPDCPHTESKYQVVLQTPDTEASNWSLHASYIWVAGRFLADHASELRLDRAQGDFSAAPPLDMLELGAAAGLPSILLAKLYGPRCVRRFVLSDYPDPCITRALEANVVRNGVATRCRVVPHAWGADGLPALLARSECPEGFDVICGADVLFDLAHFPALLQTISGALRRTRRARVHLLAGFHTGRYTIAAFLRAVEEHPGLVLLEAMEREVIAPGRKRAWRADRAEGEDEQERRRWIAWMVLGRSESSLAHAWAS